MSCKKDSTPKKHNWMKGFVITPKSKDIDHVHRETGERIRNHFNKYKK
jgi:hypothetical protein